MSKLEPFYEKEKLEACVDEAGAGPLAGPVCAAAVIWPQEIEDAENIPEMKILRDSKKLSEKQRLMLKDFIEYYAIDYQVEFVDVPTIDTINIYHAKFLAMHKAIQNLRVEPDSLLIDGDRFKPMPNQSIPYKCVVKGDNTFQGIAAASILAKVARDEYMKKIHEEFPMYQWQGNKGYGSKGHYEALKEHGPCKHHRKSFNLNIETTKYV